MNVPTHKTICRLVPALLLASLINSGFAQEVTIPDPGLNAAIRAALQKPAGPLTASDLLTLTNLSAGGRQITNVQGLEAAHNLSILDLDSNAITNFPIAGALTNLTILDLFLNHLTNLDLSNASTNLTIVDAGFNSLTACTLPARFGNLDTLFLEGNVLSNFTLPVGLTGLRQIDLSGNALIRFTLPEDAANLTSANLIGNQLTSLTLPPAITKLATFFIDGNPLTNFVLSQQLAATNLAATVTALQNQGIPVFTYPLSVQLTKLAPPFGAFRFGITGPPGDYTVFSSTNLTAWRVQGAVSNPLGGIFFSDMTVQFSPQKFYYAQRQAVPANMVFIQPDTFTLGSPTNELGHQSDESPQTLVTLTHGFWMSRFLVTQADYLAVTGANPSGFPGNLQRPIESVSWFAANDYCTLLTQQDLAVGRIPAGTHYRLPTEAEWECAARAGTTTRYNYGDDPGATNLVNHAWYGANSGFVTHPVGQKLPNAFGLFDMAGNVWEWCQDWYGPYPGGTVTDPQGPDTNATGFKVIRGSAWESSEFDCRSARRSIEGASPFISDFIIGFRVVLAIDP